MEEFCTLPGVSGVNNERRGGDYHGSGPSVVVTLFEPIKIQL